MVITRRDGFTLIELLLVVAIIGILAAIAIASFQNLTKSAQASSEDGVIGALSSAGVIYLGRNGTFPDSAATLGAQVNPTVADLANLTNTTANGGANIGHTNVAYNPATGCISVGAAVAGYHNTHTHPTTC